MMSSPQSIFKCKHCQTPLGVTVGSVLMVGAVKFVKAVTLQCVLCHRVSTWYPAKAAEVVPLQKAV
jgi:hypothetical protein